MYNPLPYLPEKFQKIIQRLKGRNIHAKIIFFVLGFLSTLWFLIRVIPKPSRANYPCMKATAPFMSGFVLYLLSLGGGVMAIKQFRSYLYQSRYFLAFVFLIAAGFLLITSNIHLPFTASAETAMAMDNHIIPNNPIGVAKGIFPGRVVWMWNPNATNENCDNTSNDNGVIDEGDNAWFMEINNNQQVIDSMMSKSLFALTGEQYLPDAWNAIFRHFNSENGNGDIGYSPGEKIMIKLNATTAYGAPGIRFHEDLSRTDDIEVNRFSAETNPFLVLSMLRQLVYEAGIPQEMIYIGDPARNIYKEFYDRWHEEFPNIHYLGNDLIHPELDILSIGRTPVAASEEDLFFFSDHGTVMPDAVTDKLFTIFEDIDYLINIPTLKAHCAAGITLAAKNHFGSFTRTWAVHLHAGLMANDDDPYRIGYGLYRVQTDIMEHKLLSGKNLFMIVDGLYPGEDALGVPEKWESIPFNHDWCSSIFMSFDPVAIESVCHDFLRTEYNGPTLEESRPNWFGVDDYLQQAADSSLWPEGIIYDPDGDGILISSLGVCEHWNDSLNKQYTRNLGTGNGIELVKVHELSSGISEGQHKIKVNVYPNPSTDFVNISNSENKKIDYSLLDMNGKIIVQGKIEAQSVKQISLKSLSNGVYVLKIIQSRQVQEMKIIKQ
jgi:hypothetical protein